MIYPAVCNQNQPISAIPLDAQRPLSHKRWDCRVKPTSFSCSLLQNSHPSRFRQTLLVWPCICSFASHEHEVGRPPSSRCPLRNPSHGVHRYSEPACPAYPPSALPYQSRRSAYQSPITTFKRRPVTRKFCSDNGPTPPNNPLRERDDDTRAVGLLVLGPHWPVTIPPDGRRDFDERK